MEIQRPAGELIGEELDKIRDALADYPQLHHQIFPCLEQIRRAAEAVLPCPVMPVISMKEYNEQLPSAEALWEMVNAAGSRLEFHGYAFWREGEQRWSLTNPLGMDEVMILHTPEDFEKFLQQLRAGVVVGVG